MQIIHFSSKTRSKSSLIAKYLKIFLFGTRSYFNINFLTEISENESLYYREVVPIYSVCQTGNQNI